MIILLNYSHGDSLNSVLPAHSMRILELYDLFSFHQLIKRGTKETLESTTLIYHIPRGGALSTYTYGEVSPIFLGQNIVKSDIFGSKEN